MAPNEVITTSYVSWSDNETPDISAVAALSGTQGDDDAKRDGAREAIDLLLEELHSGPATKKELQEAARKEDIPFYLVRRAAGQLGVKQTPSGFGKNKKSDWELPPKDELEKRLKTATGVTPLDEEEMASFSPHDLRKRA